MTTCYIAMLPAGTCCQALLVVAIRISSSSLCSSHAARCTKCRQGSRMMCIIVLFTLIDVKHCPSTTQVISLVGWPKLVKFLLFLRMCLQVQLAVFCERSALEAQLCIPLPLRCQVIRPVKQREKNHLCMRGCDDQLPVNDSLT